jgi:hypothetical protein
MSAMSGRIRITLIALAVVLTSEAAGAAASEGGSSPRIASAGLHLAD